MHKGVCVGGPFAGQTIETRSEVGFVAVDRPGHAAWLYYLDNDGRYVVDTSDDPSRLDEDGTRALDIDRVVDAGADKCLDVIAVPGDGELDDEDGDLVQIPPDLIVAEDDPQEVMD